MTSRCCNVLVIGAGPAGLAAGIFAPGAGCVLERNAEPGRKLLLAGSGQCNLTHGGPISAFFDHYGGPKKARFVKPALLAMDNAATRRFFHEHGLPTTEREDGKVFPESLRSRDVLHVLVDTLFGRGTRLETGTTVEDVTREDDGFAVRTGRGVYTTKKLILATGGRSYPGTGSTGDGLRWAERLGHTIVPPKPALTAVTIRDYALTDGAGQAFSDTSIELYRDGRRIERGRGDVLLTHRGLSGPGILDLSRDIKPGDTLHVALTPHADRASDLLTGRRRLKNALTPLGIPDRVLRVVLDSLGLKPDGSASEVTRADRKKLVAALAGYPFVVSQTGGWNEAMATAGGVALEQVDRRTMQSRLVPGLFFCGELLDVDGDTGGYNIQFALSSGRLAGQGAGDEGGTPP